MYTFSVKSDHVIQGGALNALRAAHEALRKSRSTRKIEKGAGLSNGAIGRVLQSGLGNPWNILQKLRQAYSEEVAPFIEPLFSSQLEKPNLLGYVKTDFFEKSNNLLEYSNQNPISSPPVFDKTKDTYALQIRILQSKEVLLSCVNHLLEVPKTPIHGINQKIVITFDAECSPLLGQDWFYNRIRELLEKKVTVDTLWRRDIVSGTYSQHFLRCFFNALAYDEFSLGRLFFSNSSKRTLDAILHSERGFLVMNLQNPDMPTGLYISLEDFPISTEEKMMLLRGAVGQLVAGLESMLSDSSKPMIESKTKRVHDQVLYEHELARVEKHQGSSFLLKATFSTLLYPENWFFGTPDAEYDEWYDRTLTRYLNLYPTYEAREKVKKIIDARKERCSAFLETIKNNIVTHLVSRDAVVDYIKTGLRSDSYDDDIPDSWKLRKRRLDTLEAFLGNPNYRFAMLTREELKKATGFNRDLFALPVIGVAGSSVIFEYVMPKDMVISDKPLSPKKRVHTTLRHTALAAFLVESGNEWYESTSAKNRGLAAFDYLKKLLNDQRSGAALTMQSIPQRKILKTRAA